MGQVPLILAVQGTFGLGVNRDWKGSLVRAAISYSLKSCLRSQLRIIWSGRSAVDRSEYAQTLDSLDLLLRTLDCSQIPMSRHALGGYLERLFCCSGKFNPRIDTFVVNSGDHS